jgi:hypothetical protein
MSPAPRRAKKSDSSRSRAGANNRVMAIIGLVVVASMFLSLVIVPGAGYVNTQTQNNQPVVTPTMDSAAIIATILASQPTAPPVPATVPVSTTVPATAGAPTQPAPPSSPTP